MWRPWKLSNLQDTPSSLSIYVQNFFTPFFHQVTSHSNWPCVLLFDLAHKQCNGIVKRWLHCISAKGTFIVNNILMFGSAWCLVMSHIQLSLIKNIKIGRPKHLLIPPTSDHISFLLRPPYPPSNWTSYVYHP